jgi:hypothetical protein
MGGGVYWWRGFRLAIVAGGCFKITSLYRLSIVIHIYTVINGNSNEYVRQVNKNNEQIIKILEEHFSLIEPDDVEIYTQFGVDYTRMKTEIDDTGKLRTLHSK